VLKNPQCRCVDALWPHATRRLHLRAHSRLWIPKALQYSSVHTLRPTEVRYYCLHANPRLMTIDIQLYLCAPPYMPTEARFHYCYEY
jgi:hypothetical protein